MNTITTTASTTILAIDLGKYKSVVCILDDASGEYRFTTLDTSRGELHKLLAKEQPGVVLIEACLLAGWVLDLCNEVGVRCLVANTASEAWKFKHLKRKTDKDDALRLTGGGQRRKKQAIVALARKILVRSWAMMRDKKPWHDPQAGPKAALAPSKQKRKEESQRRRQAKQSALAASGT